MTTIIYLVVVLVSSLTFSWGWLALWLFIDIFLLN